MIVEAYLFMNPDDCTTLHWAKEEEFDEYAKRGWIYLGMFDIEAGKVVEMWSKDKHWERKAVIDE